MHQQIRFPGNISDHSVDMDGKLEKTGGA